ncbi:S41 family peptidase [Cellulophaga baltica]|uniref:S41 family peptidase n=1 Tax=Cellulophaga baltica TaxID=76594 RepID=UPI0015F6CF3E|nr:S41 family peptidase [Cellulophaga baltica]MBA6313318.1 peptidase S41 [Cellulophaga baltica]
MRYKCLIFLLFLVIASCVSIKSYNRQITKLHTVEELHQDVDHVYAKLKKLHPRLYQFITEEDLDRKFDSLKGTIDAPMASTDFYKKLAPVVSEVRQGHISISPPFPRFTKKERKLRRKDKFEFYDVAFEKVDDAFLIRDNYGLDSTLVGAEVLAVNKEPIDDLVSNYQHVFSSDGYNTTFKDRFVALRFSGFYLRDKGRLDSLELKLRHKDSIFTKMLRTIPKDSSNVKKMPKDSTVKELVLTKQEKKDEKRLDKIRRKDNSKYGFDKSKNQCTRNFRFLEQDSTIAYMKIRGFSNGPYSNFYEESFQKIASAKANTLVLDLRDNTGGRLDEIALLYAYLTDKEHQFIRKGESKTRIPFHKGLISRRSPFLLNVLGVIVAPVTIPLEYTRTRKKNGVLYYKFKTSKENKKPKELHFDGALYVLINGNSFSASSILSTALKGSGRATFVGEETGGHYNGTVAGISKFIQLPNSKVTVSFGMLHIQSPFENQEIGYGIKPDVRIVPNKENRAENEDPELEWVLKNLKQ